MSTWVSSSFVISDDCKPFLQMTLGLVEAMPTET